ncbi:hypothetical protein OOT46_18340 [Aquabacterium sp. A7-Y]|uniref:hemerythrin domain-containing protein n=1 Tax=Aquabacterium sp. A7-Y TaxID=1349605 RepID=UPI00223E09B1|nr:hypothetical protein [Aquabacterium sp. A7-Y]MCW7539797.1 hypothetical protein [Aquabacterium sp. A7-Y]
MLAAQCVCSLLQAEHAVIRQTLATLDEMLRAQAWWQPGMSLTRMKGLLHFLGSFRDGGPHLKERDQLLPLMRGRSSEADRLIALIEEGQRQAAFLLARCLQALDRIAAGELRLVGELSALVEQHRAEVLRLLDHEDRALFSLAIQLLREEEWSSIASAMSRLPAHPGTPSAGLAAADESGPDQALLQRTAARASQQGCGPELRLR